MKRTPGISLGGVDWTAIVRSQRARLAISLVSLAVFLALFAFALQRLSIPDMAAAIAQADPSWLAVSVALLVAGQALRELRWWRILYWEARPATANSFQALMGGQVLNWLLPIRLGEVWRIWHASRAGRNSLIWIAGSIVVEKSADSLVLALLAATLIFVPLPANLPSGAIRLLIVAVTGFLLVGGLIAFRSSDWQSRLLRRFPQFAGIVDALQPTEEHAEQLRNPWRWIEAFATSALIWIVAIATNMAVARAFGLDLGVPAQIVLMLAIMGGVVLASVPANAAFPLIIGAVLILFEVSSADAFAYGTVLYALTYSVNLVLWALSWIPQLAQARVRPVDAATPQG